MIHRNIMQLVCARGADVNSFEEAKLFLRTAMEKLYTTEGCIPLYTRVIKSQYANFRWLRGWQPPELPAIYKARYEEALSKSSQGDQSLLKALWREVRWKTRLEFRAQLCMIEFDYMALDEAEGLHLVLTNGLGKRERALIVRNTYPFRSRVGSTFGHLSTSVMIAPDDISYGHAHYERGTVTLTFSQRASSEAWLPCPRVMNTFQKAIILDACKLDTGLWFMRWAVQGKNTSLAVVSGAWSNGILVPGYESEADVLANREMISDQAQVARVKQAILQE